MKNLTVALYSLTVLFLGIEGLDYFGFIPNGYDGVSPLSKYEPKGFNLLASVGSTWPLTAICGVTVQGIHLAYKKFVGENPDSSS